MEVWEITQHVYDKLPLEKIAWLFAKHHQVVNTIYDSHGGDSFAKDKKAMCFGSKRHYLPYHEVVNGVQLIVGNVSVNKLDVDVEEKQKRKLRYPTLNVSNLLPEDFLLAQEAEFLAKNWDFNGGPLGQYEDMAESNLIG